MTEQEARKLFNMYFCLDVWGEGYEQEKEEVEMRIDDIINRAKQSGLIQPEKSCESCVYFFENVCDRFCIDISPEFFCKEYMLCKRKHYDRN
jgi:hypothetical protein